MPPFQVLLHVWTLAARVVTVFFAKFFNALVKLHERLATVFLRAEHLMLKLAAFVLLQIAQMHPQTHEFFEITKLTLEGLFVPFQSLAQGFHLRLKLPS